MKASRALSLALRLGLSIALIAVMLARLDLRDMGRFLLRADFLLVAITGATVVVDRGLMAARWIYLLEALDVRAPRQRVMKIFFLSTFFGSFLPTGIGGEAVRAFSFSRLTSKAVETVASVVMDRLLGMLSMLLTALASLLVFYHLYPHPALLAGVLALSAATLAGVMLLLSPSLHERLLWAAGLRSPSAAEAGWRGWLGRAVQTLARYRRRAPWLGLVLLLSIGVQVLRIFQAYLLSEAMDLGTPLVYFFCFIPLILILTMLPISVSGLGTTNLAYVVLFSPVGMDPDGAFVLSVLILALGLVGNLPGGVIYALEGFAAAKATDEKRAKHGELERAGLLESKP